MVTMASLILSRHSAVGKELTGDGRTLVIPHLTAGLHAQFGLVVSPGGETNSDQQVYEIESEKADF